MKAERVTNEAAVRWRSERGNATGGGCLTDETVMTFITCVEEWCQTNGGNPTRTQHALSASSEVRAKFNLIYSIIMYKFVRRTPYLLYM